MSTAPGHSRARSQRGAPQVPFTPGGAAAAAAASDWRRAAGERVGRWALAGAATGMLIGGMAFAPARWLGTAVERATDARVQLVDASGTVWRGQAWLRLSGGRGSTDARQLPGPVRWRLWPRWLGLGLAVQADCCSDGPLEATADVRWRAWRLELKGGESRWPADLLGGLGAPWNTLQPQGQLRLRVEGLSLESTAGRVVQARGGATLDAVGLSCGLSTLRPLGSYRLRVQGAGGAGPPQLVLQTLGGSLRLAGSGQWDGTRWSFRGQASTDAEHEQVLGNLLNIVGRRQGAHSEIALD